jgi:AhpD family alkylhydroperoxidase
MTESPTRPIVEVYDPPMCCASGVCGPDPDPQLTRFSADLAWLRRKGIEVRRHSLTQEPLDFAKNADVKRLMAENNGDGLPIVLVDGKVMQHGTYPSRRDLAGWLDLAESEPAEEVAEEPHKGLVTPAVAELIAIGASIASNCEPCFVHHHDQALKFGASNEDMITAVNIGLQVKDAPAQAMVRLARRHLVPNANPSGSGCGEDCSC